MKISGATSPILPPTAEAAEGPGPDIRNDHDADDGAAAKAAPRATLQPGQGTLLDKNV